MATTPNDDLQKARQALELAIDKEYLYWRIGTIGYGVTYYCSRISLIVASSVVAAKETLGEGEAAWLVGWAPLLSVLVAIVTALETWLKPQQKWLGFMESRDLAQDLQLQTRARLPFDDARLDFLALRTKHRETNIF